MKVPFAFVFPVKPAVTTDIPARAFAIQLAACVEPAPYPTLKFAFDVVRVGRVPVDCAAAPENCKTTDVLVFEMHIA